MAYEHKTAEGSWILHSTGENGGTVALKIRDRLGKDSAFNVSLDLPGVSLLILRIFPSPFLFKVNSRQESAWEKTKNKYK